MAGALISWPDQVRWSGNRTYWSMIDRVLWSNSLMEPCSACGRNVVSRSVSPAAYYLVGSAMCPYLQLSSDCGIRLLVA